MSEETQSGKRAAAGEAFACTGPKKAKPQAKDFPDPSDREAFKAWAQQLQYPDRSNCRA